MLGEYSHCLLTAMLSGGLAAPHMKAEDGEHTCHFFCAMDYGLFGDKAPIRKKTSQYMMQFRNDTAK